MSKPVLITFVILCGLLSVLVLLQIVYIRTRLASSCEKQFLNTMFNTDDIDRNYSVKAYSVKMHAAASKLLNAFDTRQDLSRMVVIPDIQFSIIDGSSLAQVTVKPSGYYLLSFYNTASSNKLLLDIASNKVNYIVLNGQTYMVAATAGLQDAIAAFFQSKDPGIALMKTSTITIMVLEIPSYRMISAQNDKLTGINIPLDIDSPLRIVSFVTTKQGVKDDIQLLAGDTTDTTIHVLGYKV